MYTYAQTYKYHLLHFCILYVYGFRHDHHQYDQIPHVLLIYALCLIVVFYDSLHDAVKSDCCTSL